MVSNLYFFIFDPNRSLNITLTADVKVFSLPIIAMEFLFFFQFFFLGGGAKGGGEGVWGPLVATRSQQILDSSDAF